MQTDKIAVCLVVARAIAPARVGARAAPLFSMKYSTDCAVERTSGKCHIEDRGDYIRRREWHEESGQAHKYKEHPPIFDGGQQCQQ